MAEKLLVGLDLGTTNAKAQVFRHNGEMLAEAVCGFPTQFPRPGWAEQSPLDWQAALASVLRKVTASLGPRSRQVVGIGVSAHAPALVPVNSAGEPLMANCPIWQDERSATEARDLLRSLGPAWVGLGMPFAAFPAKLKWFVRERPDIAERARYALGVKGFVIGWLTGRYATDPSSEPGSNEQWGSICEACSWSLERLPPLLAPTAVAGEIRPGLAERFGLPRNLPVVVGLNDCASATLGGGVLHPGEGMVHLATNGLVCLVTDAPIDPRTRLEYALFCWPYVEGRWIVGGQTKCGAASLQWFVSLVSRNSEETEFDATLMESVHSPPGSHGVVFLPYLMGRGTPQDNPQVQGAFVGLTLNTRRAEMCRAVQEGVAFALRDIASVFEQLGMQIRRLSVAGGGACNAAWRQIVADVLGRPIAYSGGESCLGAAILASVGLGIHADLDSAVHSMTHSPFHHHPHAGAGKRYDEAYARYCQIRDVLLAAYPKG